MAVSANRLELLQIADAVAREKSISRDIVLSSMEDALQKAARSLEAGLNSPYFEKSEIPQRINALAQAALSIVLMVSGGMPDFSATARSCSSITARA